MPAPFLPRAAALKLPVAAQEKHGRERRASELGFVLAPGFAPRRGVSTPIQSQSAAGIYWPISGRPGHDWRSHMQPRPRSLALGHPQGYDEISRKQPDLFGCPFNVFITFIFDSWAEYLKTSYVHELNS